MYIKIKKQKQSKSNFFFSLLIYSLIFFVISFAVAVGIHQRIIGEYINDLNGAFFVFLAPAISTIICTYLVLAYSFSKKYINKRYLSTFKDTLAQLSVFFTIIVNAVVKFYVPNNETDNTVNKSDFILFKEFTEFLVTITQPINYIYTLPLYLSMMTLIILALEHSKFVSNPIKKRKLIPSTKVTTKTANMEKLEQILIEIEQNITIARNLLNNNN
ncbi:hypothetical protein [Lysinibacillus sp. JNUCC 51]|uniref:hypothetical protein n=1 Tax=Lysinibacillus sp. JNUCC-51 TaxID=2792479 RepID=UPI001935AD11|nr:hypothetical protein JNUCC51_19420 [Lysinibacillus sp. JNUCC-51]